MRVRERGSAVLTGILGVVLSAVACHRTKIYTEPAPPHPPAPSAPPAPTVTLTAEPSSVDYGKPVVLSWSSQNATNLDLQPAVGRVQASGSTSITPKDSTTYKLTATGPGGTESASARITVTPPPPIVGPGGGFVSINFKDAYFDYDQATIRPDAEQAPADEADFLNHHQSTKFTLEGHCDERGSEEYNLGLGDRRATAAKNFMLNAGVAADRISTISYGKAHPLCKDETEECWQQNRRAHLAFGTRSK